MRNPFKRRTRPAKLGDLHPRQVADLRVKTEAERLWGVPLATRDVEAWAARFVELGVGSLAHCTFDEYLRKPDYWEAVALAWLEADEGRRRRPRRRGRAAERVTVLCKGAPHTVTVNLS